MDDNTQWLAQNACILKRIVAHGNGNNAVNLARSQALKRRHTRRGHQIKRYTRASAAICPQHARRQGHNGIRLNRQCKSACKPLFIATYVGLNSLVLIEYAPCMGFYHARELGGLHPAGTTHKKRRPHLALERLNGSAQCLARDKDVFTGTTERACLACATKRLKRTNVHSPPPLNMQAGPLAQPCGKGPPPLGDGPHSTWLSSHIMRQQKTGVLVLRDAGAVYSTPAAACSPASLPNVRQKPWFMPLMGVTY